MELNGDFEICQRKVFLGGGFSAATVLNDTLVVLASILSDVQHNLFFYISSGSPMTLTTSNRVELEYFDGAAITTIDVFVPEDISVNKRMVSINAISPVVSLAVRARIRTSAGFMGSFINYQLYEL